ncbi:hypothetical protein [Streptomyces sp. NPDC048636]|uniref:hypothetical protein n=1 Tax=Streptomyces sp. NPDC048636 TaxID=3155762 RepID=UPI003434B94B
MSDSATSVAPGPLPEAVAALLRAVLEAIEIPDPATGEDEQVRDAILADRARDAVVALHCLLGDSTGLSTPWNTGYLRRMLAAKPPIGYGTAHDPERGDGEVDR